MALNIILAAVTHTVGKSSVSAPWLYIILTAVTYKVGTSIVLALVFGIGVMHGLRKIFTSSLAFLFFLWA